MRASSHISLPARRERGFRNADARVVQNSYRAWLRRFACDRLASDEAELLPPRFRRALELEQRLEKSCVAHIVRALDSSRRNEIGRARPDRKRHHLAAARRLRADVRARQDE